MDSHRILTFLHAKEQAFFWQVSEFQAIDRGVEAKAEKNHYLRILFNPREGFKILLLHQGLMRKKIVKRLSKVSPFDLHDAISNVLALITKKQAA
ncbi:hypothetical protein [Fangia hongkongensis]|uniref:hypothetical protein n=1 Tax=Fangia hongkongensis TaxID=270495 RepID=UPI00037BDE7D|nr:hypothetical protein [Fangia hongkongensis]MBK2124853.1 hypothetical protein [Fangia hongkongensis]